jgi:hypothetical protein
VTKAASLQTWEASCIDTFLVVLISIGRDSGQYQSTRVGRLPFGIVNMKKRDNRNSHLRAVAMEWAQVIKQLDSRAARWIAIDALRELQKKTS